MNEIICNVELFDAYQRVKVNGASVLIPTDGLAEYIANSINGKTNIHLFGATEYIENIGKRIVVYAKDNYSLNDINILYNK